MTTTDHLQFSVLAAPLAAIDRRSLSQAWYSALYGAHASHSPGAAATAVPPRAPDRPRGKKRAQAAPDAARPRTGSPHSTAAQQARMQAAAPDRRAPRSPLARKIERAFLQPKAAAQQTAFALASGAGRVKVLLRSSGSRVDLVAICPRNARAEVAAALAQARYALALCGIDLTAEAREERSC